MTSNESSEFLPSDSWTEIPLGPLTKSKQTACTLITRGTLMALLCFANARPVFHYSGASGHRAAYAAYCGQWRVDWPIGELARVYFCAHYSHFTSKEMYPITFQQRVDKCLQMLAGVVDSQHQVHSRSHFQDANNLANGYFNMPSKGSVARIVGDVSTT